MKAIDFNYQATVWPIEARG